MRCACSLRFRSFSAWDSDFDLAERCACQYKYNCDDTMIVVVEYVNDLYLQRDGSKFKIWTFFDTSCAHFYSDEYRSSFQLIISSHLTLGTPFLLFTLMAFVV